MNQIKPESLAKLISEKEVVKLLHRSNQNSHYWALKFPFMEVVKIPHDFKGYRKIRVEGFDEVELYCKN